MGFIEKVDELVQREDLDGLEKLLMAIRNELCFKCGNYREAHMGACNGCQWRDE